MKIIRCKWCGSENIKIKERPDTPHFAESICANCGKHIQWISNPNSKKNPFRINHKTIKEVLEFHKVEEEICFLCLRKRSQLGLNETLTIDHIIELDKGGIDQIWNMQILCSACHKLKNWLRLYLNWHLKKEEKKEDDNSNTITK